MNWKLEYFKKKPFFALKRLLYKTFYVCNRFPFWKNLKDNVVVKGKNIYIGKNSRIYEYVILKPAHGYILIGDNVNVHSFCFLSGIGGLKIGDNTRISNSCCFIPFNHEYRNKNKLIRNQPLREIGINIGEDCWIGSNCSILGGTNLGRGCVVGAGSVVNKEFPPFSVIAGVPAKIISRRE